MVVGMEEVRQEDGRATLWRFLFDQNRIFWFAGVKLLQMNKTLGVPTNFIALTCQV